MTLLLLACLAFQAPAAPAGDRVEAERLARAGQHAAALQRFEALAAANPGDLEARIWIGRLNNWMGRPVRSRAVFESILATHPDSIEALVGAGSAALNSGDVASAARYLDRAETLMPEAADTLAAQGRLHRLLGNLRLAEAYYDRAVVLSPSDPDIREGRDTIRAQRAHRIDASYGFEHLSIDVPDTHAGSIDLNVRAADRVRVFGRVQQQRKFGLDETRGGGGLEWQPSRHAALRASGIFANDTVVFPVADASFDVELYRRSLSWMGSARHLRFDGTNVWIASLGGAHTWRDRTTLSLRYYWSHSAFTASGEDATNNSGSVQLSTRASRKLSLSAGYARGYESFETLTIERVRQRGAHTWSGGATWRFSPMFSASGSLHQQRRDDDTNLTAFTLAFVQRF